MSPELPRKSERGVYQGIAWQLALLIGIWIYLVWLHRHNDGLWYQGDAPRHAINGLFWMDLLADRPGDIKSYAVSYYVRYPTINPVSYPPVFYIITATSYAICGASAFVAKGVVLAFALVMAIYVWAWLRRWLDLELGWVAPLVLLAPDVVEWSHAVMLNIPSVACQLAALFHFRVWMDGGLVRRSRHLWLAVLATLAATLTHYTGGSVLFVMLAWLLANSALSNWKRPQLLFLLIAAAVVILPFAVLFFRYARQDVAWLLPNLQELASPSTWLYYPAQLTGAFGFTLCALAACGLGFMFRQSRYRGEQRLLAIWCVVVLLVFTLVKAKESRYILQVVAPIVGFAAITIENLSLLCTHFTRRIARRTVFRLAVLALLAYSLGFAHIRGVPSVAGYRAVAEYVQEVAPHEAVFYDGFYHGIFTYYIRAQDPSFAQRVVLGQKSLYSYAKVPGWKERLFVDTEAEVLDTLCEDFGCRWLVVEYGDRVSPYGKTKLLRSAVELDDVVIQKSFPIEDGRGTRVCVYRINRPVGEVDTLEIPMPSIGEGEMFRARPIPTRSAGASRLDGIGVISRTGSLTAISSL